MHSILHIMNYSAPYRGNFIESLENLDSHLNKEGYRNIYLFPEKAKSNETITWIKEMQERGIIAEFLTSSHITNIKLIKKMISEYSVEIVHTHFITIKQFLDITVAVSKRTPIIMHMHNHSEKSNKIKETLRQIIYKRCIFIACSQSVFESLKRDYPNNKKYAIDNAVCFTRLDSFESLSNDDYGVDDASTKLLIFGFDFYRKGVDLALKAISDLRKSGNNFILMISLASNFDKVKDQVQAILGELPDWVKIIKARNDVATLYNYVDIFLSPSREEGLPYSVIEAGYSNCSIVLSDISAQRNLKLKYGYWFKNEDVIDLEDKILLAEKEHSEKLENLASVREFMKSNYSLSTWSGQIISIYKSVLK